MSFKTNWDNLYLGERIDELKLVYKNDQDKDIEGLSSLYWDELPIQVRADIIIFNTEG